MGRMNRYRHEPLTVRSTTAAMSVMGTSTTNRHLRSGSDSMATLAATSPTYSSTATICTTLRAKSKTMGRRLCHFCCGSFRRIAHTAMTWPLRTRMQ